MMTANEKTDLRERVQTILSGSAEDAIALLADLPDEIESPEAFVLSCPSHPSLLLSRAANV